MRGPAETWDNDSDIPSGRTSINNQLNSWKPSSYDRQSPMVRMPTIQAGSPAPIEYNGNDLMISNSDRKFGIGESRKLSVGPTPSYASRPRPSPSPAGDGFSPTMFLRSSPFPLPVRLAPAAPVPVHPSGSLARAHHTRAPVRQRGLWLSARRRAGLHERADRAAGHGGEDRDAAPASLLPGSSKTLRRSHGHRRGQPPELARRGLLAAGGPRLMTACPGHHRPTQTDRRRMVAPLTTYGARIP
jgi:hypothetical protein